MAVLPIAIYPAPILKQRARAVEAVTDEIRRLLDDMTDTMYAAPGIGLAGPQVHQDLRVIIVDVGEPVALTPDQPVEGPHQSRLYQLVNPEIVSREGTIHWEEGCLSLPELHVTMERSAHVVVTALDRQGAPLTIDAHGLLAVALQHEIDHLDGRLLVDQLSRLKRQMYLDKLRKQER